MNKQDLTLLTDLYELTMMQGYYVKGQKAMFQIGTSKPVCLYFLNISHIHGAVKHGVENQTNTGFSLAASADQHKHLLTFGGWNQAVTQILL